MEALKVVITTLAWCDIVLGTGWLTYLLICGEALRRKCKFDKSLMQKLVDGDYNALNTEQLNCLTCCKLYTHIHIDPPAPESGLEALVAGKLIKILYHNTTSELTAVKLTKRGRRVVEKIPLLKQAESITQARRYSSKVFDMRNLLRTCKDEEFPELLASSDETVRHFALKELERRKREDPAEKEEVQRLIKSL